MIPYRKLSDMLRNGNCAIAPPNPPKVSKVETTDRATDDALDGLGVLGALGALHPGTQKPAAAPESAELIAPSPWFEYVARPAVGNPALSSPVPRAADSF
jgi:hypothetical protein